MAGRPCEPQNRMFGDSTEIDATSHTDRAPGHRQRSLEVPAWLVNRSDVFMLVQVLGDKAEFRIPGLLVVLGLHREAKQLQIDLELGCEIVPDLGRDLRREHVE